MEGCLRSRDRRGAAAVELALLLPLLVFIFLVVIDFARVFYFSQVVSNCARNGALYASNLTTAVSPYASVSDAALADASNLTPAPTVTSSNGTDTAGNPYVSVTVSWTFSTISHFPGIPETVPLSRTSQMRVSQ
jgi:Flp pilus assembly protein TadG